MNNWLVFVQLYCVCYRTPSVCVRFSKNLWMIVILLAKALWRSVFDKVTFLFLYVQPSLESFKLPCMMNKLVEKKYTIFWNHSRRPKNVGNFVICVQIMNVIGLNMCHFRRTCNQTGQIFLCVKLNLVKFAMYDILEAQQRYMEVLYHWFSISIWLYWKCIHMPKKFLKSLKIACIYLPVWCRVLHWPVYRCNNRV